MSVVLGCSLAATVACSGSSAPLPAATPSSPVATTSTTTTGQAPIPTESNPPGDIPDNLAFVRYANTRGGYSLTHPEGWAQVVNGTGVTFTDKLSGVAVTVVRSSAPPTVATARRDDVPRLRASVPAFELRSTSMVQLPAGPAVRIVFRRNSDADPVTGRRYRDEVEEYLVWKAGRVIRLDLFGVVGADNVDAYRTMRNSLRLS
jgi:hypothetical protein